MELLDGEAPYLSLTGDEAVRLISSVGAPVLKKEEIYSGELRDFVSLCLTRDADKRPASMELLQVGGFFVQCNRS